MTSVSNVCQNLFSQTTLAELPHLPSRGSRRNIARLVYRQARRPGLVNPQSEPGPRPVRKKFPRREKCVQKPMQHVYKLHEPPLPKKRITFDIIPRLVR
jgi:hypothetical protein